MNLSLGSPGGEGVRERRLEYSCGANHSLSHCQGVKRRYVGVCVV